MPTETSVVLEEAPSPYALYDLIGGLFLLIEVALMEPEGLALWRPACLLPKAQI